MGIGKLATLLCAAIALALLCVPAGAAGQRLYNVDRELLKKRAERKVEKRRNIEVITVSRCNPTKRKGKINTKVWVCYWRAEGVRPGDVPYHCAGKARWKRKRNRWVIDPCRNRIQPISPLLPQPNPHPTFGYNDDWIFESEQAFNMLADAGGQVARTALPWSGVEGKRGRYSWHGTDVMYERLVARGIRPVWALLDAPCWAQPKPAKCANGNSQARPAPAHYDEMADFALDVVRRYPRSAAIEVWNEPNYPRFWGGWPEPRRYAQMFKKVANKLHAQAPGVAVVTAGLSPHADSDKSAIGYSNFLAKMYRFGAVKKADAIGIHPYPSVGPGEDYVRDVRRYLGKVQAVMRKRNDADRPLWATEFGVSTAGPRPFSDQQQAQAIIAVYQVLRRTHHVPLAILHRFVEDPELGGREAGFGVVSQNLVPKPAYCAIVNVRGLTSDRC